jgi:hypothetical protein
MFKDQGGRLFLKPTVYFLPLDPSLATPNMLPFMTSFQGPMSSELIWSGSTTAGDTWSLEQSANVFPYNSQKLVRYVNICLPKFTPTLCYVGYLVRP